MNRFIVRLPESIYKNENLTSYEKIIYAFLCMVFVPYYKFADKAYVSIEIITKYMFGENEISRKDKNECEKAWQGLREKGLLINNPKNYLVGDNKYFVQIPIAALQDILCSGLKNKADICIYLMWLVGTFNHKNNVGCQKIEYLAKSVGVSTRTVQRYNSILEDMGVIEIVRSDEVVRTNTGFVAKENNRYCISAKYT